MKLFARHCEVYAEEEYDTHQVWKDATEVKITLGDLRRARLLLARHAASKQGAAGND